MEGDSNNPAFGYGGYAASTNPYFSNFASPAAAAAVAANPGKLVTMGDNGGYYTYNNYTGPDGNGAPVYGETPWMGFDQTGKQTSVGVMQKAKFNDLALMAALSAVGMGMFLPGMMAGGAGAGAGAAGIGGAAFGDAGLMYAGADAAAAGGLGGGFMGGAGALGAEAAAAGAGTLGGTVSTGLGSYFPMSGATGAGMSSASAAGGGLFGGGGIGGALGSALGGGGGMWGNIAGGLMSLGGSLISSNAAKSAAGQYNQAAQAAADASKFRPVGITTRFGSSNFGYDSNGNLTSAGYAIDPRLSAMQDYLMGAAEGSGRFLTNNAATQGQSLFNLGSQYLAKSPEEAAQEWMSGQQSLLAPSRERALSGIRTNLFNTGRTGLAVGATGERPDGSAGLGAANPELEAYYNSLAQQDAQLATQADAYGRDRLKFGTGLFGSAIDLINSSYDPTKTQLGLLSSIEQMGQTPLDLGAQLGGRSAQSGAQAAQSLLSGARAMQGVNSYSPFGGFLTGMANNPQLMQGVGSWFSGAGSTPHITQMPSMWELG